MEELNLRPTYTYPVYLSTLPITLRAICGKFLTLMCYKYLIGAKNVFIKIFICATVVIFYTYYSLLEVTVPY